MDMLGANVGDFDRYIISLVPDGLPSTEGCQSGACTRYDTTRPTHARLMAVLLLRALPSWTEQRRVHA